VEWARLGKCNQCGDCCDPALVGPRLKAYMDAGYMPHMVESHLGAGRCPHFTRDAQGGGLCAVYPFRPDYCKAFPTHPMDIAALPRCGYTFLPLPLPESPGIGARIPGIGGKLPARAPRPMSRQTRRRLAREEAKRREREARRAGEAERAERLYRRHT